MQDQGSSWFSFQIFLLAYRRLISPFSHSLSSVDSHIEKREVSSYKDVNPIRSGPQFMSSFEYNYFLKPHWELGFTHINFGGTQTFSP